MSSQDEVFGLPFLFTGGLPNSLEKFSEGNLRCFLIYLIEVVGKANRQNVWQKPAWWRSRSIPYSPISVDTRRVPQEQVVKELRGLIESCYKYYKAEKILEVSRQLAEIPRILLGVRDNKDNTMTVYDTNSKAVYVTVRPENLYYDAKSLNKVSKDWRSSYTKEDVAFCEIKKASKQENQEANCGVVIEVLDSDEDIRTDVGKNSGQRNLTVPSHSVKSSASRGVVIKSGENWVIALSDSDSEDDRKSPVEESAVDKLKPAGVSRSTYRRGGTALSNRQGEKYNSEGDNDVEFICEQNFSRPCPKRFKKQMPTRTFESCPNILILSDSDDDPSLEESAICISSYTSLAKNYPSMKYYMEAPKNVQTSILGPLICSPRKETKAQESVRVKGGRSVTSSSARKSSVKVSSDEEDIFKPTKEELFLRKKKKKRAFYSYPEPPEQTLDFEGTLADIFPTTQSEFMARLGMKENDCSDNGGGIAGCGKISAFESINFVSSIRSMRTSFTRMPLEWIRALSCSNHIILSKKSSLLRFFDPTHINYEPFCSTDKNFVEYNIKSANMNIGKEGRSYNRQGRRGKDKNTWTIEKWCIQSEEGAQRSKRASLRMLKSLCSGDYATTPEATLNLGSLAPTLHRLPDNIFEHALHSTVSLKNTF